MAPKRSALIAELMRRRVHRVAVGYVITGVGVLGAAEVILDPLGRESWRTYIVILVLAGFPIALLLAWMFELKRESPSSAVQGTPGAGPVTGTAVADVALAQDRSIAVLPFTDLSPGRDQEYLCDGMVEELINALSKVKELHVAARTSSFHFKGRSDDIREIGTALNVKTVLEGSVRRDDDRIRVTVQLASVADGYHLWSQTYDRVLDDVFEIQIAISRSVVATLLPTLRGEGPHELVEVSTRSLEAYDHYLLGRYNWERRHKKFLMKALQCFVKAAEIDSEYALAYAGIADSYSTLGMYGYMIPSVAREQAASAARRGVELGVDYSQTHASLGYYQVFLGWDWDTAATELDSAIDLKPRNALAHAWLGVLRGLQGHFDQAFSEMAVARELAPFSDYVTALSAIVHVYAREFEPALQLLRKLVESDPGVMFNVWLLSWTHFNMSDYDEAVETARQALLLSNNALFAKAWLGVSYGRAGRCDAAQEVLDELSACDDGTYVSPLWLGWLHFGLGHQERALDLFEEAAAKRSPSLFSIHQDSFYRPFWGNPRFPELASKVGSGVVSRAWD